MSSCWISRSLKYDDFADCRAAVETTCLRSAYSTSSLSVALGVSQRTVQRALVELEAAGRVRSIGRARAALAVAPPLARFTTNLLLTAALPLG